MLFCSRFTIPPSQQAADHPLFVPGIMRKNTLFFPPAPQVLSPAALPGLYPSTLATERQVRALRRNDAETRYLLCIWGDEYPNIGKHRNAKEWDNICKCVNKNLSDVMKTFRTVDQCKARKRYLLYQYKKITKRAQMPKPRSFAPFSYMSVSKASKQVPDWSIETTVWLIL